MNHQVLVFERTYEAPIDKVWSALTNAKHMRQWYFDISEFRPEIGFTFEFTAGPEGGTRYRHICEVTACIPPEKLSYTWRYEGFPGNSEVTFELFAESERETRLKLTHTGIESFPNDDPAFAASSFTEGWNHITGASLRNFVETDVISKQINIEAAAARVWEILVNPNEHWGPVFGSETLVRSDWRPGSNITWTDANGDIGALGIINKFDPPANLELRYYDEVEPKPGDSLGAYTERFELEAGSDGTTVLTIAAGPIEKMHAGAHAKMWDDALRVIKKAAE
ncbi:hypothetical protein C7T94_07625 [Pedobacter yulinensis]|uniref:Activator of Hsp90 ATPase homologue 1/2-like C-terminal domain-containing protein n=1 Tax=Pedobacter yulinensis TaxID=2126353 RepID=A0A2T3HJB8_9SPHI|nr:SRPBCC domain-containing protein [Pedobacter yulinensis]PST82534.1 hypothetical protein C7T94_07625 [Pedobacter yulinensis]